MHNNKNYIYIYIYIYVCVYVCVDVCICTCMCVSVTIFCVDYNNKDKNLNVEPISFLCGSMSPIFLVYNGSYVRISSKQMSKYAKLPRSFPSYSNKSVQDMCTSILQL